jgi:AraC-like DNA-binding protein
MALARSALLTRYAGTMIASALGHGVTWSSISAAVQLSAEQLRSAEYDNNCFLRISRQVKLLMSDEFCGFTHAPCRIGTFVEMCERALSALTVGEALESAFSVYAERNCGVSFQLSRHQEIARITISAEQSDPQLRAFLCEWWFMLWPAFVTWLAGEDIPIVAVELAHPAGPDAEEYMEALGTVCRFGQPVARLLLPASRLQHRVRPGARDISVFMAPTRDHLCLFATHKFKFELRKLLRRQLAATQTMLSIEDAAAYHHITSQTLRRRLLAENTSYRAVKEEVRREAALDWLARERMSIAEASYRAGFAEPNGLSRALKSWTGISPTGYRDGALA